MIKNKRFYFIFLAITLLIFIVGCSSDSSDNETETGADDAAESPDTEVAASTSDSEETMTLSLASMGPIDHPFNADGTQAFMDKVVELTDGRVEFDYYPSEQMGAAADLMGLARDGTVDIAWFSPAYVPSEMVLSDNLFGLPGIFESAKDASLAYFEVMNQSPMLEEDFLNNGVRPMFITVSPPYGIGTNGPEVKLPEDLAGLKIRAAGGTKTQLLDTLGAIPVTVSMSDLYSAVERGVVEGAHAYHIDIDGYGITELFEFSTTTTMLGSLSMGMVMNEGVYQDLPADIREAFDQASAEITESLGGVYDDVTTEVIQKMADQGVTMYENTEEELAVWEAFYEEYANDYLEAVNNEQFVEVYEMILEALN